MLYSRSLLVIYFIYSSVYMLIPNYWFSPLLSVFVTTKFVFYACESVSIL